MRDVVSTCLAVILLCVVAGPAAGQFAVEPPPVKSSYWWTLSDDISPAQLRHELQSRRLSRERLKTDIEAHRHEPVSEERLAETSIYVNGAVTPELIPVWDAFDRYTFKSLPDEEHAQRALERLKEWGLSAEGAEVFEVVRKQHWELKEQIFEQRREGVRGFVREVLAPAHERMGRKEVDRMVRSRDFAGLARLSGKSEGTVREWNRAWLRDPIAEAGRVSVETLRESLSGSDWEALRRFLLRRVAPRMTYEYFSEGGYR